MKKLVGMATIAVAAMLLCSSAQAQGYLGSGYFGSYGLGLSYLGSPYAAGRIPTPPYFALHPPVYYSQPVARTYGYSPFAYPGTERTPEVVQAELIENPHVTPAKSEQPGDFNLTKVIPAEITNPFVTGTQTRVVNVH